MVIGMVSIFYAFITAPTLAGADLFYFFGFFLAFFSKRVDNSEKPAHGVPSPGTALGWNFGHIAYCTTYYDGLTTWYYAYFPDGGYAFTNNPGFTTLAASACQTGNLAGLFVTRLNPFQWNAVATFPYK
jgi:hypothetical protein